MIEQHTINEKNVWIKVDPWHVDRSNPNIIPTEYFVASYYLQHPGTDATDGKIIKDENEETKLFESPVAALSFTRKKLERVL